MSVAPSWNTGFLFLSSLLGRRVVATDGKPLGRLADVVVIPGEPYPPIVSIVFGGPEDRRTVAWSSVKGLQGTRLVLQPEAESAPLPAPLPPDRLLLAAEILDKQLVDVEGAKVVRVNDLHFLDIKGTLRLAHADVGFRGLVRRMGWQSAIDGLVGALKPRAGYLRGDVLVPWKLVQPLDVASGKVRLDIAQRQLAEIHPADLAEILEDLDRFQRAELFKRMDVSTAAETLEETSSEITAELIKQVTPERAADILEEMGPDEAADVLSELPRETQQALLGQMERPDAREVQALLGYPPRSAGGLMTTDLVKLVAEVTALDALAEVRRRADELPIVYELFVVDAGDQLRGVCTLKDLVASDGATSLGKLMREAPGTVGLTADIRDVAEVAAKYNLLSVPVVDEAGLLRGIITVDDILGQVLHGS
ncbi:MAG: magnesium transporter [Deltaproteobacteria bacterium]